MSGVGKLYRILREGIRQRSGNAWKRPQVGDLINVSDEMGPRLVAAGYAVLASAPVTQSPAGAAPVGESAAPTESEPEPSRPDGDGLIEPGRCPEHPRYQGRGEPRKGCEACARLHAESHSHEPHASEVTA